MGQQEATRVYMELRSRIITNELRPGTVLRTRSVAEQYRTSTTPVRDALNRLGQEGWVEVRPRSQCVVAPITFARLTDVLEVREATGPMCCRLAARRASSEDIDRLSAIAEGRYSIAENVGQVMSASHAFHCEVARLSGNRYFMQITEQMLQEIDRIFSYCGRDPLSAKPPLDDHRRLIEALRQHDEDLAAQLETEHLAHTRKVTLDIVSASGML